MITKAPEVVSHSPRIGTHAALLAASALRLIHATRHATFPGREYDPGLWLAELGQRAQAYCESTSTPPHTLFCPFRDWMMEPWACDQCRHGRVETACAACREPARAAQLRREDGLCRICQ